MFDGKTKEQLKEALKNMKDNVNLVLFTQEEECETCSDMNVFLEEITALSDKLNLEIYDFQKDKDKADLYNVDKVPVIVLLDNGKKDWGLKFYGIPAGHEINAFITSLLEISGNKKELPGEINERISNIKKDVHLQVFVLAT
ncbi:thioredoxin domain-containing protein [Spirochaetota bacterium]